MDVLSATQLSLWSTFSADKIEDDTAATPLPSVALNFLTTCLADGIDVFPSGGLAMLGEKTRVAGTGGYGTIEVANKLTHRYRNGKMVEEKKLVAIKRAKAIPQSIWDQQAKAEKVDFNAFLEQLTLELRILSHNRLLQHPNIVDVLGLYEDMVDGSPSLSIVLEYSEYGSLRTFLSHQQDIASTSDHIHALSHVIRGINALHDLHICHGDVKTQNALVFWDKTQPGWCVKISDFGQSLMARSDDPTSSVKPPPGTLLLNAPEIRRARFSDDGLFTIHDAILTDLYSLGLLAWEVLLGGQDYFQSSWLGTDTEVIDAHLKVDFLDKLPVNGLLGHGLQFLDSLQLSSETNTKLQQLMSHYLQDIPECRERIPDSFLISGSPRPDTGVPSQQDIMVKLFGLADVFDSDLSFWSTKHSMFDVAFYANLRGRDIFTIIPPQIRTQIVRELKSFADSPALELQTRAHSALAVAECFSIGFGDNLQDELVLEWLHKAALLGQDKSRMWYHRIYEALNKSPDDNAPPLQDCDQLSTVTGKVKGPEDYFIKRIHSLRKAVLRPGNLPETPVDLSNSMSQEQCKVVLLNGVGQDQISAIHVAAWLGEDDALKALLLMKDPNETTTLGLNAAHYACLGGHLSTLRILMRCGTRPLTATFRKITPLHFAIFFQSHDLLEAVDLLLRNGAIVETASRGRIYWDSHDLRLDGTAMDWAILARYRELVQCLLPHYSSISQVVLHVALKHFYWEILEILLPRYAQCPDEPAELLQLSAVEHPFHFWLAHGQDGPNAIKRTVQLWAENGLIGFHADGSSHLTTIVCDATTTASLQLIQSIIDVSSDDYVRHQRGLTTALSTTMHRGVDGANWERVIRALVDRHSLMDLQWHNGSEVHTILWQAVEFGSPTGLRVILEKGVDVDDAALNNWTMPPLHLCVHRDASSPAKISLLLEFGANAMQKDNMSGFLPLEWAIFGVSSRSVLDVLLGSRYDDAVYAATLELARVCACIGPVDDDFENRDTAAIFENIVTDRTQDVVVYKQHRLSLLRYLLSKECFSTQINSEDDTGTTFIQRAAFWLHLDSIRILLDAQADATVKFERGGYAVLPLQIACTHGRGFSAIAALDSPLQLDDRQLERKSQAFSVACELLQWHSANGDSAFQGITKLHLACRMAIGPEIEKLLETGYDVQARGTWPGVSDKVTPRDLLGHMEEDDFIIREFPSTESLSERFQRRNLGFSSDVTLPTLASLLPPSSNHKFLALEDLPEEYQKRVANASISEYSDLIDEILDNLSDYAISQDSDS